MRTTSIPKQPPSPESGAAAQILNSAAQVFAESGYGGARMDEIARRAGVNKAAIYYHIGNKAALYNAVFEDMFSTLLADLERNISRARTPQDKLRAHVRTLIAHKGRYPHFAPIVMREVASGFSDVPDHMVQRFQQVFGAIAGVMKEGASSGAFREANPFIYHLMTIGIATYYAASERLIARFDESEFAEQLKHIRPGADELVEQFTSALLRSLEPDNT